MIIYKRWQISVCRFQVEIDNEIENSIKRIKIKTLKK